MLLLGTKSFSANARRYLLGTALMGIGQGATWAHLNLYFRTLGLGEEAIGRLLSAGSLGTVLMALPAAMAIDRFPAGRVFSISALAYALALAGQLIFVSPWALALAALVAGAAFTVHWVASAPFFVRNSRPEERTDLFAFAQAVETVATLVASLGVGVVATRVARAFGSEYLGLRTALLGVAALCLFAVFAFRRIESAPPARERSERLRDRLRAERPWLIFQLVLPGALVGFGAGLAIPFLNLYFRDRFGVDPLRLGSFYALAQGFTVIGFLLGPRMARRLGLVRAAVLTELLSIPFFLLLATTRSLGVAVGAFWMRGALMNMNQPLMTSFAMEVVAPGEQAVTNSYRTLGWNLSWMGSSLLGGYLIERHGYNLPMFVTMALYALASSATYVFFRDRVNVGRASV